MQAKRLSVKKFVVTSTFGGAAVLLDTGSTAPACTERGE